MTTLVAIFLPADVTARVVRAAWDEAGYDEVPDFGLLIIRDCNGGRALDTLLRYRGSVQAELFRALATLKALQAEAAQPPTAAPALLPPAGSAKRTQNPL